MIIRNTQPPSGHNALHLPASTPDTLQPLHLTPCNHIMIRTPPPRNNHYNSGEWSIFVYFRHAAPLASLQPPSLNTHKLATIQEVTRCTIRTLSPLFHRYFTGYGTLSHNRRPAQRPASLPCQGKRDSRWYSCYAVASTFSFRYFSFACLSLTSYNASHISDRGIRQNLYSLMSVIASATIFSDLTKSS